jgi:hypothetical protein
MPEPPYSQMSAEDMTNFPGVLARIKDRISGLYEFKPPDENLDDDDMCR